MDISNIKTYDLLNMVNSALKQGISVNKFSKDNGLNSSTVKTRLKRSGYMFNADLKQYIKNNNINNKPLIKSTKNNIENDTKENIKNSIKRNTKSNIKDNTNKSIKDDIKRNTEIEKIIIKMEQIENRLLKIESKKNNIKNNSKSKHYIENTRDTSTKSIRLYTEVKEQLDEYLSNHKEKKVIEVFSYAILDYINKYK